MRVRKWVLMGAAFAAVMLIASVRPASAFIVINEILADPASGSAGDANGDGVTSSRDDEFVELLNCGDETVDLSGWTLSDAVRTRHTFQENTILSPFSYLVIFAGGTPVLSGLNWQTASSSFLGLNNGSDTVTLLNSDFEIIDQAVYGSEAGDNQSIVRAPEGSGPGFVKHSSVSGHEGVLFSPGYGDVAAPEDPRTEDPDNGDDSAADAVVPELPVWLYLLGGFWMLMFSRRKVVV